jgi:ferric-dicitrate binding protein FerR (iron transport regulator)
LSTSSNRLPRDADAYIALAERSGLTAKDCLVMATILAAKGDPAAALTWTERGLGTDTSYDLRAKHRELLTALGRHDEAIQNEWSHFTQVPTIYSYKTLMVMPAAAVPIPETYRTAAVRIAASEGMCPVAIATMSRTGLAVSCCAVA